MWCENTPGERRHRKGGGKLRFYAGEEGECPGGSGEGERVKKESFIPPPLPSLSLSLSLGCPEISPPPSPSCPNLFFCSPRRDGRKKGGGGGGKSLSANWMNELFSRSPPSFPFLSVQCGERRRRRAFTRAEFPKGAKKRV